MQNKNLLAKLECFVFRPIFEREGRTSQGHFHLNILSTEARRSGMARGDIVYPLNDSIFQHHPAGLLKVPKQLFDLVFCEIRDIPVIGSVERG